MNYDRESEKTGTAFVMKILREYFSTLLQSMRHGTALCILYLLLAAGTAGAETFKVNGITYKTVTASTVQVGNGTNKAIASGSTSCAIPVTVTYDGTSYTVKSIGDSAFELCSNLTSVTLPASLTTIGESAFYWCSDLTSVTLPASLTSIGDGVFSRSGLTSVTLPASLKSIGDEAFAWCLGLTSVTLPASLTSIGDGAFYGCLDLTDFIVPSENPAFCAVNGVLFTKDQKCLVACPNGRRDPFYAIPNGVTSIGDYAFSGCSGLTSVIFPESLTNIGNSAFSGCLGLTAFIVPYENPAFCVENGVLFNKSKTILMVYPPGKGCSYTVPNGVTNIGDYAFPHCDRLTSVTLPASLTNIGDYAFYNCDSLDKITYLGTREPSMGNDAFSGSSPDDRVLYIPNVKDGFTASKWGASEVVYWYGKWRLLFYVLIGVVCVYCFRKWKASSIKVQTENSDPQD